MRLVKSLSTSLKPVTLEASSADTDFTWVRNLSEPGLLDRRMTVLKLVGQDGRIVATLTNFACHPTILGPANTLLSADYLSGFYKTMEEAIEGEHMFLQGAIGGWVQPLQGDRSVLLAERIGSAVAEVSIRLIGDAAPMAARSMVYRAKEFDVPLDNAGFRLLIALGVLERELHGGWFGWSSMRTEVAYFRLAELNFVTHPGETSPYYAHASRKLFPNKHVVVMGLTQDAMGYILKPDYFARTENYPHAEYLVGVSAGPQAGPLMLQTITELVGETKEEG